MLETTNITMVGFDLVLGLGALVAPRLTLGLLGHAEPSRDTQVLFRRCGPVWMTYAVAHANAVCRDSPAAWSGVAWLRATEIFTDVVWATSPAFHSKWSRRALRFAGAFNLGLAAAAGRRVASA